MRGNAASVESATVTAVLPPAKPVGFTAEAGDGQVTLTWDDPRDTTIGKYQYQQSEDGGSTWNPSWTDIPGSDATTVEQTVTGLTNDVEYTFKLRAVNRVGAGAETAERTATPAEAPLAPTGFSATSGDERVFLRWTAAANNGAPLTGYQYQQDGGAWNDIGNSAPDGANAVSFTVTGLSNDVEYTFKLRAVNRGGGGAETAERTATPAAQNDLWSATLTAGKHDSYNRFGYNSEHGYGSLSSTSFTHGGETYTVTELEYHSGSSLNLLFTPNIPFKSALTLIVDGEEFPASDAFSVSSSLTWVNPGFTWAVGDTADVSLKATPPDAPANFSAAGGNGEVALAWTNPSDTTITKYQYRQKEGTGVNFGNWNDIAGSGATTTSHTVAGLTVGAAYTFQVRAAVATLGGAASETATAIAAAPDKNAPVFASDMYSRSVAENSGANTNVGAPVTATDADSDMLTYSLSGTDAPSFAIGRTTGQITVDRGATLDYETKSSYTVIVSVHDGKDAEGNTDDAVDDTVRVTISVTDVGETSSPPGGRGEGGGSSGGGSGGAVNSSPVFIEGASTSRQVAENTAAATEIGDPVAARDANSSDRLTYSLSGTDASSFDINVGNGQLLTKAALDYETKGDYTVVVVVSDGRRRSDRITVTVTVTNVEEPEFVGSASVMYEENGTDAVETYTTDPEGTSVSWSLSGADAGEFTIDGGELRFAASPDFEAPRDADSDNAYEVMVETADGTGNTGTVDVTVTVGNVEEPGTLVLSTGSPVLGSELTATLSDPDGSVSGEMWVWVRSTDRNTWTAIGGATSASYTPASTGVGYYLRVTVSYEDGHGPDKSRQAVSEGRVLEFMAPMFPEAMAGVLERSVAENTGPGEAVGALIVAASANGGAPTYALGGLDAALFAIDADTGQIMVGARTALDYEVDKNVYEVTVTAADSSGTSVTVAVTITVTDVDLPGIASDYDADNNEMIDRDEALAALADYFSGAISKEEALEIIQLYFSG